MKKVVWIFIGIVLLAIVYYLFLKPFEFEVNFKAKTLPGDLVETIRIWNRSLDSARVVEVDSFTSLKQEIYWKGRAYLYYWRFFNKSDSLTEVKIQISEPKHRLKNKLAIPFTAQPIESDAAEIANVFYDILKLHLEITRVKLIGPAQLNSSFCLCRSVSTKQTEKANGMMMEYSSLVSFIDFHNLKADGPPMVRVNEWSHNLNLLKFDFCFPILPQDELPQHDSFYYKTFQKEQALKAEYYGNYITSDRAWYELIHYANQNGYKTSVLPVEYFHNNPNLGMNESNWKAEVYLPLIN